MGIPERNCPTCGYPHRDEADAEPLLDRLAVLVDAVDSEYGEPNWERLKAELRRIGVKVRLTAD